MRGLGYGLGLVVLMTIHVSHAAAQPVAATPRPSIERLAYKGWPEAYRLSNGTVEVIVVPAIARIMRYGYVGGPNVLWENSALDGRVPTDGQWANFGGNKVWIWPQEDWPARTGSAWPPATDLPAAIGQQAEVIDGTALRLTSPLIAGFGVRTTREIRVASSGTRVFLTSAIERQAPDATFRLAAWTVTQMPADGLLLARLVPDARLPQGYRQFGGEPFASVTRARPEILVIDRPPAHWSKIGMDGDLLAWQRGEDLFVERSVDTTSALTAFAVGDRAQIYSHPDADPGLPPGVSYVELELTAPLVTLKAGARSTLTTTWDLVRLGVTESTREALARRLLAQSPPQ